MISAKIPYIKELMSFFQGYSANRMDTQWMEQLAKVFGDLGKIASGKGIKAEKGQKDILKLFSTISGLPFYNVYRDTLAGMKHLGIIDAEELEEKVWQLYEADED